ncbi:insulin-induced protein-domain-containing protein [Lasiosphaeria hispida]|uniref:Insulin-induced protein-domain-containing protein n=1 Tax=Lasiosphaeria hispida TaxID=260671 RepID=A0AAJ0HLX8_9PEZI|nr:insulin-induced protein-domain-containing protein [Lasiosphaeria hispida]
MDSKPGEGGGGSSNGPQIIRPIPRRPFNLNFTSPTPPEDEPSSTPPTPHISASDLRFLDPRYQQSQQQHQPRTPNDPDPDPDSLAHSTSFMNLTSSTLFGIYDDTTTTTSPSPWGTGAETPVATPAAAFTSSRRPHGVDDATYALMRERSTGSAVPRRTSESSYFPALVVEDDAAQEKSSKVAVATALLLRAVLLFVLGMGYGVLVTRLPSRRQSHLAVAFGGEEHGFEGLDWRYLGFWGGAGVGLGSLLPWFDRVWEETFDRRRGVLRRAKQGTAPEADWALVVRGIGAFVGIVFAIRRLPWTSTMQVSLTLALANPFLWYLIDRSKPGFLLSATVSVAGSTLLMGLNPDVMPAPAGLGGLSAPGLAAQANKTSGARIAAGQGRAAGAGFASQETVETGIWMLSVLFCSCVCFGNIGRRLALNKSAATRGRWGGVR